MSAVYLDTADQLLRTAAPGTRGTWPRACAWLLRIELEIALDDFWARVHPEIGTATHAQRPRLLLPAYTGADVARRVSYVWWALSRAGHHHHYELGITAAELGRLRDEVVELLRLLRVGDPRNLS